MVRRVSPAPKENRIGLISVIVPVGGGERPPGRAFFERLFGEGPPLVDLVAAADPAASPDTCAAFEAAGGRVRSAAGPRGRRLAEAAAWSSGDVLLFLHADTLLPAGWRGLVEKALDSGAAGGAFRLAFDGGGARMAWVAFWANLRTGFTGVPYGDQAPFVRRDVYQRLGGHRPWPLLEDWDFSQRLKEEEGAGRIALLHARVRTSPRRYLERGVARTVLKNWEILWKVKRGQSPERLAGQYRGL